MKNFLLFLLLTGRAFDGFGQTPAPRSLPFHKGFFNQTEVGVLLGTVSLPYGGGNVSRASFTASSFNGYRFGRGLALGATVGVDWYASQAMLPLSMGLRGDLGKGAVSPFYALDAGYGLWLNRPADVNAKGGLHLNPALGLRIATGNGTALSWSIGYKFQRASTLMEGANEYSVRQDYRYNRLVLKMGISF